jgi:hypothetical protein
MLDSCRKRYSEFTRVTYCKGLHRGQFHVLFDGASDGGSQPCDYVMINSVLDPTQTSMSIPLDNRSKLWGMRAQQ